MSIARTGAAAALTAVLVAGGTAVARTPAVSEATGTTTTETTYTIEDAGTVTVLRSADSLQITQVAPASGWSAEVESFQGVEVEAVFSSASAELDFEAEIEDGVVTATVRTETSVTPAPAPAVPAPTSTVPDESSDDGEDSDDTSEDGDRGHLEGLPDHVDLSSRPASLRASETAFEHAGGPWEPPVGTFDVPGVGTVTLGVDADGALTVDAPGWDHEVDAHGNGGVDIELTREDAEVELRIGGDGSFQVRGDD